MAGNRLKVDDPRALREEVEAGLADSAFALHFQPKFDPATDEIVGLEALLRWNHPSAGWREASWFMQALEREADLVARVDAWVLGAAAAQGRRWRDRDLPFGQLNVNLSSWALGPRVVDMVAAALGASGFPGKSLALECPWRLMVVHGPAISATMRDLRKLGCPVVLDGNPLDRECLDLVGGAPLDMSKVCIDYLEDFARLHGLDTLGGLARAWRRRGVEVVAIGVETDAQAALAHRAGCRLTQGNRFRAALPAHEIDFLLKALRDSKKAFSFI